MITLLRIAIGCLVAGWIVYPLAVNVVGRIRDASRLSKAECGGARVSLLIATRDPVDMVKKRVSNIEAHRQEVRLIEIIVALDHAAQGRADHYRTALGSRVLLVAGDAPGGKAASLNAAVRAASGDILIFTDSAQQFLPGAMKALVERLHESGVGASTGILQVANNKKSIFLRAFWAFELWLRRSESRAGSIVAITGAIYALHRSLWNPLPTGLICDDLYVPLMVIQKGFRVVSCDAAVALDSRLFGARQELNRKVRTLTGMLQMCVLFPWLLNPWQNRAWLQFVFHKLLRIVTPALISIVFVVAIARLPLTLRVELLGSAFVALVVLLLIGRKVSAVAKVSRQIGWSVLFLCAPCIAVANAIRGKWDIWNSPSAEHSTCDRIV